jgi:O-antigen ligase
MNDSRALPAPRSAGAAAASRSSGALLFVYFWWVLMVMEPEWFLGQSLHIPLQRIPTLLSPVLLLFVFRFASARAINWPFTWFMLLNVLGLFYAENRGFVEYSLKVLLYFYVACIAFTALVNTPARMDTALRIYLVGYIWYGLQGLRTAKVWWHPLLGNEDSYGPLMVIGLAFAHYLALATPRRSRWRLAARATSILCCIGVVSSIARGAVLAFLMVIGGIWLRSRRKIRSLGMGFGAAIITMVAIQVFWPNGEFWNEMASITSEGNEAGTGQHRWIMWTMAIQVFENHPIFGVGPGNWGVVGSHEIAFDAHRPEFKDPARLYNQALHNIYVQILSEGGIVGMGIFVWMTTDFFRRVKRLRSRSALAAWHHLGGELDLRNLSYALELAMVGFLGSAFFYNQLWIHWYWTLITLAFTLSRITTGPRARSAARMPAPAADSPRGHPVPRARALPGR